MTENLRKTPRPPSPWEVVQRAIPILGLVVLVLGLCWLLASVEKLTAEAVTAILVAAGGILLLRHRRNGTGGGTAGAGLLVLATLSAASCAAHPCLAERASVASVRAVVEVVDYTVGLDTEEWEAILEYTRGSLEVGDAAVAACETAQERGGWLSWLEVAIKGISGILRIVGATGVDVPDYLLDLLRAVGEALGDP